MKTACGSRIIVGKFINRIVSNETMDQRADSKEDTVKLNG